MIRAADYIAALIKHNRLDLLLPAADVASSKPILREFWRRFRRQYGSDLAVFDACSEDDLSLVVPCKIHGDEGRSAWSPFTCQLFGTSVAFVVFFSICGVASSLFPFEVRRRAQ